MPQITATARWVAAQRARESKRPDCLFTDSFASRLAGEEGTRALELSEKMNPRREETSAYIAIRVKFLDDFVQQQVGNRLRQVVLLGAGMDARAFRLPWPEGTSLYEVDHPELLRAKEEILKHERAEPRCQRMVLGVDLTADWSTPLKQAGFSPTEPSVWILEGLLYYLSENAVHRMLQHISELACQASALGADLVSGSTLTSPWLQPMLKHMENSGFAWKFGTDDPECLFQSYGWTAEVRQPGEPGANFGRWQSTVVPRAKKDVPRSFLLVARKD